MDNMEYISCIKDGVTGICRDIKDKTAREQIALLQELVTSLGSVDVTELQNRITELSNKLDSLDNTYATDENITNLQSQINDIQGMVSELDRALASLDTTYATDEDINALQGQITNLNETINGLDSTYATDEDIKTLQGQITSLNASIEEDIKSVNENIANVEHVDTVYDMASTDNSINLGERNGLAPNIEHNINLTKYKKLRVYIDVYETRGVLLLDMTNPISNNNYVVSSAFVTSMINNKFAVLRSSCRVPSTKNSFYHDTLWFDIDGVVNSNTDYKVIKIEGVY